MNFGGEEMEWYWYLLLVAGAITLPIYLRKGWKEYLRYREHFYNHHSMSYSANYRLTDLYVAGLGVVLLWPVEKFENAVVSWFDGSSRQIKNGNHA